MMAGLRGVGENVFKGKFFLFHSSKWKVYFFAPDIYIYRYNYIKIISIYQYISISIYIYFLKFNIIHTYLTSPHYLQGKGSTWTFFLGGFGRNSLYPEDF